MGWLCFEAAALSWLVYLIVRESKAITLLERAFVALIPLSMYATGATIGNGQLIIHLLPALLFGLLLLYSRPSGWRTDLSAAFLILLTLVKPSVSVPFFWMLLFALRVRPAVLVTLGYVGLTRAKDLLLVAVPNTTKPDVLKRFKNAGFNDWS